MDIISQDIFFIKFEFVNIWNDRKDLTYNQMQYKNRELREFFKKLHEMPLDIGKGEQSYFYIIDYYKLIHEIDNCLKDRRTYLGKRRKQFCAIVSGLLFEVKWMGSIVYITEATKRIVAIAKNLEKTLGIPKVTVYLGAEAIYYEGIEEVE